MKDNQHEQLFTELTAKFEAPVFTELDDEVAASCSGGRVFTGGSNPDIILYRNVGSKGAALNINAGVREGIPKLANEGFNDQTSSIVIKRGRWSFYEDTNYNDFKNDLGPGTYTVAADWGIPNDKLSSLKRIA